MIKAVNMKGFEFKAGRGCFIMQGFGLLDEEAKAFISKDGRVPYVVGTKRLAQSFIDSGCLDGMKKRVAYAQGGKMIGEKLKFA